MVKSCVERLANHSVASLTESRLVCQRHQLSGLIAVQHSRRHLCKSFCSTHTFSCFTSTPLIDIKLLFDGANFRLMSNDSKCEPN